MRTKNSRAIDAHESAHMADVKMCACVFCNANPPVEAHHVKQGRHFCTVAACPKCHAAKAWRLGHPNEFDAIDETLRRVARLRATGAVHTSTSRTTRTVPRITSGDVLPKIVPRRA